MDSKDEYNDGITEEEKRLVEQLLQGLSSEIPSAAWRVPLSYECKERCRPFRIPRLGQLRELAPTAAKIMWFWFRKRLEGRKPFIDPFGMLPHKPIFGVPMGGIGSGSIGRGYHGEFCRFQLVPGDYVHSVVETNLFVVTVSRGGRVVYSSVLSVKSQAPQKYAGMRNWKFAFPAKNAAYVALYPRSWSVYKIEHLKLRLICRQVSPVIPHNYSDSCLPVVVFVWTIEYDSPSGEPLEVSIALTFKNGVGHNKTDHAGSVRNYCFSRPLDTASAPLLRASASKSENADTTATNGSSWRNKFHEGRIDGVLMQQRVDDQECTFVLAARAVDNPNSNAVDVSTCSAFDPHSQVLSLAKPCSCVSHQRSSTVHPARGELISGVNSRVPIKAEARSQVSGKLMLTDYAQLDESASVETTHRSELSCLALNSGAQFWNCLSKSGRLLPVSHSTDGISSSFVETHKRDVCTAVCATTTVRPGQRATVEIVLGWHMPVVQFKARGRQYKRRYSRWFSTDLSGAVELAAYAAQNYAEWEREISKWQEPVLTDSSLPDWYKYALFNETYFVTDGGTVWLDRHPEDLKSFGTSFSDPTFALETVREMGHFGYLEGHEYRMYNTYDVHFYASPALIKLWPSLQYALQVDFAQHALIGDAQRLTYISTGENRARLDRDSVPHDIGDPEDEPFVRVNGYGMSPSSEWKDLAAKFVLMTYRDTVFSDNPGPYLRTLYPVARTVFDANLRFDTNGDTLPDHTDVPDSTFDAWLVHGACVYTSVLWLSALFALVRMADRLLADALAKITSGLHEAERGTLEAQVRTLREDKQRYETLFKKAQSSIESQFWNESVGYYQFGSNKVGNSRRHQVVMAAGLVGYWYLQMCANAEGPEALAALDSVLPRQHIERNLRTIYRVNVNSIQGGQLGAINGAYIDGSPDYSSMQSEEIWTGVVYALAASMLYANMPDLAMRTARGCFTACLRFGLHFQTPEAIFLDKRYRSLGYMRPLSIWSMQQAIERLKRDNASPLAPAQTPLV